jgi:nitrogen fixation protein FixH
MEIRHDDSSGLLKIRSVAHNNADLPASGASVQLVFFRPTNEGFDTTVMLSETDVGVYEGETRLPKRGTWDLKMIAARDGEVIFRSRSRIDVR